MTTSEFSAGPSIIGYLYQIRFALCESLRRNREGADFCVSLETLDDVVFERAGTPTEILQTKHHVNRTANLTDASSDLWKTIRIWCESFKQGKIPSNSIFYLITTSTAPHGSAASYLKKENRDVVKAIERLNSTVASSSSEANQSSYDAYKALSHNEIIDLFSNVFIIDSAPSISNLDQELKNILFYAVEVKFLESLINRLEGWWVRRIVSQLSEQVQKPILGEEINAEMVQARAGLMQDNLPIAEDILNATVDTNEYTNNPFVRQLELIGVGKQRIYIAVSNYFKAFTQRSRWMREELLLVGELRDYERRLVDEWKIYFEQMKDEIGEGATEEIMQEEAKKLYKWAESGDHRPIRPACTEPFVSRGTLQMLSDKLHVGWHPEFGERLKALLEPQEVVE